MNTIQSGARARMHGLSIAGCLLLASFAGTAAAVVEVEFLPPAQYTPGDDTSSYRIRIENTGSATVSGVDVSTDFPSGVELGTPVCNVETGTASCNATTKDSGANLDATISSIADGALVEYTLPVTFAPDLTTNPLPFNAEVDDNGTISSSTESSELALESDLAITAMDAVGTSDYVPGSTGQFDITVENGGPSDAVDATLTANLPLGVSPDAWSCSEPPSTTAICPGSVGSGSAVDPFDLPAGGSLTFTLDVTYDGDLRTDPDPLTIGAEIAAATGVTDDTSGGNNNTESVDLAQNARVDLAVSLTPDSPAGSVSYIPGTPSADFPGLPDAANTLTVTVRNVADTGTETLSDALGASVTISLPEEIASADWECLACPVTSGSGDNSGTAEGFDIAVSADIDSGASIDIELTDITYESAALANPLEITAAATAADDETDTKPANDDATNQYALDRRASITVEKVVNSEAVDPVVNPLDAFDYKITVTNEGPSDVGQAPDVPDGNGGFVANDGILLTDVLPSGLFAGPSCPGDGTEPCFLYCASDIGATGSTVTPDDGCTPDVEPDDVAGSVIFGDPDSPPIRLQLAAGNSSEVRLFAILGEEFSTGDRITNTASIRLDPNSGITEIVPSPDDGNESSASVGVELQTDLVVTKTASDDPAVPGEMLEYTITVFNDGNQTVGDVRIEDLMPEYPNEAAGFVPDSTTWQCLADEGACCNANTSDCGIGQPTTPNSVSGSGLQLNQLIDLGPRTQVEFTVSGRIDPRSTGPLSNTAKGELPTDIREEEESNNESTEEVALSPDSALRITKELETIDGDSAPFTLTYLIEVSNAGPSFADDARVSDLLGDAAFAGTRESAVWTCTIEDDPNGGSSCESGTGVLNATVDLDVDSRLRFELVVDTNASADGLIRNEAGVSATGGSATIDVKSNLEAEANLVLVKTDGLEQATPGTEHEYTITIKNNGPDPVFNARVVDEFPPELENAAWTCDATTPIPGDLAEDFLVGASGVRGGAVVGSADGFHVYQVHPELDRVATYRRDSVPGVTFGSMNEIETEENGVDDITDAGGAVENLDNPIDVALSPDQRFVYVLSDPPYDSENDVQPPPAVVGFVRTTNRLVPDFGRLSFADSFTNNVPANPSAMAVTRTNVFVAGGSGAGEIAIFERSEATGLLTHVATQSSDVPADPSALAVDRDNNVLAVGSASGQAVALFSINDDDTTGTPIGELTWVDTAADPALSQVVSLHVAPNADHLYVTAAGSSQVSLIRYSDQDEDGLPELEPAPIAESYAVNPPNASALAPDGEHLLVLSDTANTLTRFRRDPISGLLPGQEPAPPAPPLTFDQPLPGDNAGLDAPTAIAFTSDGRHVLVSTSGSGSTDALAVYSRRAPDPLFELIEVDRNGDPEATGSDTAPFIDSLVAPTDIAVSPDGQHVYTVSEGLAGAVPPAGAISVFKRDAQAGTTEATLGTHLEIQQSLTNGEQVTDAAGELVNIAGMPEPGFVLVSPNGESVYVTSEDAGTLVVFDRDGNPDSPGFGNLTFRRALTDGDSLAGETIDGLSGARGMAMDAGSRHLYVAGGFDDAVAVFDRAADGSLTFIAAAVNGIALTPGGEPVSGLDGVRDLAIAPGAGRHLIAVSDTSDAAVVFERQSRSSDAAFGELEFIQRVDGVGDRPVSVDVSPDGSHVYVAAENSDSVSVLRRITGSSDPASFGRLVLVETLVNGGDGLEFMSEPRDVAVSPDGNRVYVAARGDAAVLVFDRDRNENGARFGTLKLSAVSRDGVAGVDGLDNLYAVTVAIGSRNVYAVGFDDRAVASFALGVGSICTGSGSGTIDDLVTIGNGGFIEYRIQSKIRPDATGTLSNTAWVELPPRVAEGLTDGIPFDRDDTDDDTVLRPRADLVLTKTNDQVSVTAGEPVTYEIEITNIGPSNLANGGDISVAVSDLFAGNDDFVPGSVTWSCQATGSGALTFVDSLDQDAPGTQPPPEFGLDGVAGMALVADSDGAGKLGEMLATVSVTDDALSLFARDPGDGSLVFLTLVADGDVLGTDAIDTLDGARDVYASPDGRFLYVVSQVDDALTVFAPRFVEGDANTTSDDAVELDLVQSGVTAQPGLDQPSHVIGSPDGAFLYVAASNDDAVSVFRRNADGTVTFVEVERNGVNDPDDTGGTVQGLDGVTRLVISPDRTSDPDGAHLYAISATGRAVARFDRDPATGELSWVTAYPDVMLDVDLRGASGAAMDPSGRHLYITAGVSDRIVALARDNDPGSGGYGTLTKVGESVLGEGGVAGLLGPRGIVVSRDGLHVYAVSQSSNAVTWFLRDPTTGALTFGGLLSNQSTGVSGLAGASDLVLDPDLDMLYTAGTLDAAVARFRRSNDSGCEASGAGELANEPIDIAAGGTVTFQVTALVSPDVPNGAQVTNTASVEALNSDPDAGPVDLDGSNNQQDDSDVAEVVADLRITKDDGRAEFDGLAGATAVTGTGDSLYVAAARDEGIGVFARTDATGELTFLQALINGQGSVSGLTDVADVELSGDAAHVYAVSPTDNTLVTFDRAGTTGELAFAESLQNGTLGITGLGGASDLALSPDDRHVYVAGSLANSIAVFRRQADPLAPEHGRLTFLDSVQNGSGNVTNLTEPTALAVSADGLHVYAVSPTDAAIVLFTRNPNEGSSNFGSLIFETSYADNVDGVFGLAGAADVVIAPGDEDVYVLGADGGTLARFKRDVLTGELTFQDFKEDGTAGTTGLAGASAMRISPDGTQMYVASPDSDAVLRFDIAADGSLTFAASLNGDPVLALDGVADLLIEPGGAQLYSVSGIDDAITTFLRDAAGDLAYLDAIFDGLGGVSPGSSVQYTIVVENLGPSDVTDVTVVDDFPDTFSSVTWVCNPEAGADCTNSGTGSINDGEVDLPNGARVTYTATGVVREDASGRLVNTATVSGAFQDPVIANNSATDDDTVLSPRIDLITLVDDGLEEATPGERIEYTVSVTNDGPSLATDVRVRDAIPPELFDVTWTCSATPVEGLLGSTQALASPLTNVRDLIVPGGGPFAYAAGDDADGNGAVVVYLRDAVTGELSQVETYAEGDPIEPDAAATIEGLQGASALAVSSDGSLLFAAGAASDSVVAFERDATSGLLTYLTRLRDGDFGIDGLGGVTDLLVSPIGPFLYAAGRTDDAIAVFRIDAGGLTFAGRIGQGDAGVDGLNAVSALAWDQGYLLAVAEDNDSLAAFRPSSTDGLLAPAAIVQNFQLGLPSPAAPLNGPVDVVMADDRIIVAAAGGDAIAEFRLRVDSDATPDPTAEFEFVQSVEDGASGISDFSPASLAWAPRQQRLYVGSPETDTIHLFSLRTASPELLAEYTPTELPGLSGLAALRLPVTEGPLYATAQPGGIAVLARQRGSLCPVGGERSLGDQPVEIAGSGGELTYLVAGTIFPNATGELFYAVTAESEFVERERERDLADNTGDDETRLVPRPDLSVVKTDDRPDDAGGLDEVVAGTGLTYTMELANAGPSDAIGALFEDSPPIHPEDPGLVSGSAAWNCSANPPLTADFALDTSDVGGLAGAARMAFSASGARLTAANPATGSLLIFAVDPVTGAVALEDVITDGQELSIDDEDPVSGLAGASAVTESRDGRFIYAVGETANSIVVLERTSDGGFRFRQKLQSGADGVFGLIGPQDVVLTPNQRFVYAAAPGSDAVTIFSRADDTGLLTFVGRVRDGFGTIVPDSDVIRGVRRLHVSLDDRFLYAVAPDSDSVATFAIDEETGDLTYRGALRAGDAGVTGMTGVWSLVASPGDAQLYLAGRDDDAIVILDRDADSGALTFDTALNAVPGLAVPELLTLDASGSRLYVAGDGALHVFARDWIDGSLDYRDTVGPGAGLPPLPADLLHQVAPAGLFVIDAANGTLARINELALSRCLTDAGTSDAVSLLVDLGVGGFGSVDYAAIVDPAARGELVNLASLTPGVGTDFDPSDNAGVDSTTVIAVSDLSVSKSGPAEAVAGEPVTYEIVVQNQGPSDALGIVVTDIPPAALQQVEWACAATPESSCPAVGTGAPGFDFNATVRVGGQLTITVDAIVDSSFIGPMTNTVVLTPEPGATDPTVDDLEAGVTTDVIAVADVAVDKTTVTEPVVAGQPVQYRLTAFNDGPSDAPVVALSDVLPAALQNASWTCVAIDGAGCPAGGNGDVGFDADLPAASAVEVTVTASLPADATGSLSNTFTATVAAPVTDPDTGNNQATRVDAIAVIPDLALALVDPLDPFDPAGPVPMPYVATVTNLGPSLARGIEVDFDASDSISAVSPGCFPLTVETFRCQADPLMPGESRVFDLELFSLPDAPGTLAINAVTVTSGDDPDLANNAASTETEMVTGTDLNTTLDNGRNWVSPGEPLTYELVIANIGSVDAPSVDVDMPVPAELLSASWACFGDAGAVCQPTGSGPVVDNASIPSGGSLTYILDAIVDPDLDLSTPRSASVSGLAETSPTGDDINPDNNMALDDDDIRRVMFEDGFETLPPPPGILLETASGCIEMSPEARGAGQRPMVIGRAEGGRPLFSVETRIHRSRNWVRWVVRGISEVDTAPWQPWPDETLVIRVDDDAFAVLGRTGATLRSPVPLPAPLAAPTAAGAGACGAVAE